MNTSTDVSAQLSELAAELTGRVAEMLAYAARNMETQKQQQIYEMLETNLPDVVTNTILKTTILHTPKGVDHLKANLDMYATQMCERFIKNDM